MHWIDLTLLAAYLAGMLGVGFYFFKKNRGVDDYFVGGRDVSSLHVGLSVVATDVGGGFSIGLSGLGFAIGISGSWLLFTGLIGAWLSAVFLIPQVKRIEKIRPLFTFPEVFEHLYGRRTALIAAVISAIGYLGFTSSQILAGAKLASASFAGVDLHTALWIMGVTAVVYTALGGLKAVIYTDTIQWLVLMGGLLFVGLPFTYLHVGGWEAILSTLPPGHLSLSQIGTPTLVNWAVTIIPIWFVAMTLFQRIYACRSEKDARRAWFIAGVLEWPVIASLGVTLGILARVAAEQGLFSVADPELGLPVLLRNVLPAGFLGIVMASYFSAILSTADSCLMAASGNVVTDLLGKKSLRLSQIFTLVLGLAALLLATAMQSVLDMMLYSYAFMVSGLVVPMLGGLFLKKWATPAGAIAAMLVGGTTTVILTLLPEIALPFGLDANVFGISASAVVFFGVGRFTS